MRVHVGSINWSRVYESKYVNEKFSDLLILIHLPPTPLSNISNNWLVCISGGEIRRVPARGSMHIAAETSHAHEQIHRASYSAVESLWAWRSYIGDGELDAGPISFIVFQLSQSSFGLMSVYVWHMFWYLYMYIYMDVNTVVSYVIKLQ